MDVSLEMIQVGVLEIQASSNRCMEQGILDRSVSLLPQCFTVATLWHWPSASLSFLIYKMEG